MGMKTCFPKNSICHGLQYDEFVDLPKSTKRKLLKLMSRLSEKSYRRGVVQAVLLKPSKDQAYHIQDIDINKSKGICDYTDCKTIDRFFQQNESIRDIGFCEKDA
jgi:ribosome biogenesis protein Tsr3